MRRRREDALLEEEIAAHLAMLRERYKSLGMTSDEAERRARVQFGNPTVLQERQRAVRGFLAPTEWWRDVRYGARMLAKAPGFTAIAVISLALGIGANTLIFTYTKSLLLDKLAVPHPDSLRLLMLEEGNHSVMRGVFDGFMTTDKNGRMISASFTYPIYEFLRAHNHSLEELFGFLRFGRETATVDNVAKPIQLELVSGNYFRALEVKPLLGRAIDDADDGAVGSGPVADISYAYWTRQFGRSRSVIGKKIAVNSIPITVVGVTPRDFTGTYGTQDVPDIFMPFSMQPIVVPFGKKSMLTDPQLWWVMVMGRVKPGVPEQRAQAALNASLNDAVRATMTVGKNEEVPTLLLKNGSRGLNMGLMFAAKPAYVLTALAGLVLLLACANLANLLLAREGNRQREMCVRLALGASRGRVLRQVLTESLMLSLAGGAAGLMIGYLGRNAIPKMLSTEFAPIHTVRFDWRIFAFAVAASVLTGLLFGIGPAWQATRAQVSSGLKDNAQTATKRRHNYAGKTIVMVQVALSMLLLVGAGLFVRTLANLDKSHLGFRPENILLFDLQPPRSRYKAAQSNALYHQIAERLRAVPGVDSVSLSLVSLISGGMNEADFIPEERSGEKSESHIADFNFVGDQFFKTLGIPMIAGRSFEETDTASSTPVAVINEALAKKYYPHTNPIGRRFKMDAKSAEYIQIVGICGNTKFDSLRNAAGPTYYTPYRQNKDGFFAMTFEVHTRMPVASILPQVRGVVGGIDRDLPLIHVRTQMEQIRESTRQDRMFVDLTSGFGVLALVLACIGIYGILAYTVSRRTNEIGIRMALGAQPQRILRMVVREAWWLTFAGVVVGLGAALAMGRLVASMLYGLQPYDPVTLGAAALLLAAVAIAASWIPARRAAGVDPMRALRHE
jgi:predicted permease